MSRNLSSLSLTAKGLTAAGAVALAMVWLGTAQAQTIRSYIAQPTTNTIVADGVISPGEWDGADVATNGFNELRTPFDDADTTNNRFQMLYDDNNLYILYQTDNTGYLPPLGAGNPNISFAEHNLNLYIDPNQDGDLNKDADGVALTPGVANGLVDGYQLAFNQYTGTTIATADDRQGIGFYTEAHANGPFGDNAAWNKGGSNVAGAGIDGSNIVVGSTYAAATGGLSEIVIPFADLDADALLGEFAGELVLDGEGNTIPTGLNATGGASPGDKWGFNIGVINLGGDDPFLPIWNWHDQTGFAYAPTGEITFGGDSGTGDPDLNRDGNVDGLDLGILLGAWDPAVAAAMGISQGAVPEPTSAVLFLSAVALSTTLRRRR